MNKHVLREWYKLCICFDDKLNQMQDGPAKQFIPNLNSFPMSEKFHCVKFFLVKRLYTWAPVTHIKENSEM